MRNVTENFKIDIRTYGRQLDFKIKINDVDFNVDNLNYIKPAFNTPLFKTVMHQVEIDSKLYMPKDTKIYIKVGVKVNEKNYNYIELGTYYVKSCERQEDTNSYRILAYTKMKNAMVDYDLTISEKITVRNYLVAICERLGWNTENIPATFINSTKLVSPSLHTGINYTFRDALDEIATITCSFLLFKNDDFYLSYLNNTNETIDESYLDEDNITIGEKYLINSLVFSRAEESDNIYRKDDDSIEINGLHEYRISDCQLLSTNDRDDYIDEMFNYLKTLEFYIFDIQSKGILFLEACDMFNLVLNGVTYPVALLNNEINIEDGLTENLYMDEPEETETEYKYADSTDKKINQAYILVDKQNQTITQVVQETTDTSEKLARVTQTVDELNSKIQDIADITTFSESMYAKVELDSINESEPIQITVKPTIENISYLYPNSGLYPSETLYPKVRTLRFINKSLKDDEEDKYIDFIFPNDLLIASDGTCDEFYLGYDEQICQVIKRCKYNEDGTVSKLDEEQIISYEYPKIQLKDGDYTIELLGYTNAYLGIRLMAQNIYTSQYATKAELSSNITQTKKEVDVSVNEKLTSYSTTEEMNSAIKVTADNINSEVKKKVNEDELGTKMIQNHESIQIAWNKITEFIQFINAQLQIKNDNKKLLMALDKIGQHFYRSDGSEIGYTGLIEDNKIAFVLSGVKKGSGMVWGIKYNDKFIPVFSYDGYNTETGTEVGGNFYFEAPVYLQENILYLSQDDNGPYIQGMDSGDRKTIRFVNFDDMYGNDVNGNEVFTINNNYLKLYDYLEMGLNLNGYYSYDLKDNYIINVGNMATSDVVNWFSAGDSYLYVGKRDGNGFSLYTSSSDKKLKKNIKSAEGNALDIIRKIKHKQFDWKSTDEHQDIGYIAQEMENVNKNFVHHHTFKDKNGNKTEDWQINVLAVLATATKAIQEQQKQIEQLQKEINNLKGEKDG